MKSKTIKNKLLIIEAISQYGRECMLCRTKKREMCVEHIEPNSPLENDLDNIQILCNECNKNISPIFPFNQKKHILKMRNKIKEMNKMEKPPILQQIIIFLNKIVDL